MKEEEVIKISNELKKEKNITINLRKEATVVDETIKELHKKLNEQTMINSDLQRSNSHLEINQSHSQKHISELQSELMNRKKEFDEKEVKWMEINKTQSMEYQTMELKYKKEIESILQQTFTLKNDIDKSKQKEIEVLHEDYQHDLDQMKKETEISIINRFNNEKVEIESLHKDEIEKLNHDHRKNVEAIREEMIMMMEQLEQQHQIEQQEIRQKLGEY